VAALVVPDYEQDGLDRDTVRERVREHMARISAQLPLYKRVRVTHLWDMDLPKTSTRKVKRREVLAELERLERAAAGAARLRKEREAADHGGKAGEAGQSTAWVRDVIAQVTQKKRGQIQAETRLDELGFDSLMFTELGVALEASGVVLPNPSALAELDTVADVEAFLGKQAREQSTPTRGGKPKAARVARVARVDGGGGGGEDDDEEIHVPEMAARLGRRSLRLGMRMLYERVFHTQVTGRAYIPPTGGYIVAANHASHLDMGLVKHALGEQGELLVALAARDYFFDDPVRRAYFENFTNLVPMERYGSLRESLRLAGDVVRSGHILLIFPEGTRSVTGVMSDFKQSLGYLALHNHCGILPMYLAGTHDALPKGSVLPKNRDIAAHIGPFAGYQGLVDMTREASRTASYRAIADHVERVVRGLAPAEYEWTLGEAGRQTLAAWQSSVGRDEEAQ
jgi:long-chain acyl-CoA synthetase